MLRIDCRGARRRSGMTQEAWAREVFLSLDRVRSLEYRPGESPGWDSAYRMALLGQFLGLDGPEGPMALAPLHLILHPEAQALPMTVLEPVSGQTSLWGAPVLVHAHVDVERRQPQRESEDTHPQQLLMLDV